MNTITFPRGPLFDDFGKIAPGAILVGYEPDTDNLKEWYYDADLQTLAPNPVQAASDGRIPQIFLKGGKYRIRQYVPASEQSVIPDDMTDFPVGDDWTFVTEWMCEGDTIQRGTKTLVVDFVRDLANLGSDDASWVLVMNHSDIGDCYPRWFFYTPIALTYNNGSCFAAKDGGSWFLSMSKGETLDARVFGLNIANLDNSAELQEAADFAADACAGLYVPKGVYQFSGNATIVFGCPVTFADEVKASVAAGYEVVFDIRDRYNIAQRSDFRYSGNFHLDFSQNAYPQEAHAVWNAAYPLANCFNGQNLVLDVDGWLFVSPVDVSFPSVVVVENCGNQSANAVNIGTLASGGGKMEQANTGALVVNTLYSSAFIPGSYAGWAPTINTLVLDDDIAFYNDISVGEVRPLGGKITSTDYLVVADNGGLPLEVFETKNDKAILSVLRSNHGVADLQGFSCNTTLILNDESATLKNGVVSYITANNSGKLVLDHIGVDYLSAVSTDVEASFSSIKGISIGYSAASYDGVAQFFGCTLGNDDAGDPGQFYVINGYDNPNPSKSRILLRDCQCFAVFTPQYCEFEAYGCLFNSKVMFTRAIRVVFSSCVSKDAIVAYDATAISGSRTTDLVDILVEGCDNIGGGDFPLTKGIVQYSGTMTSSADHQISLVSTNEYLKWDGLNARLVAQARTAIGLTPALCSARWSGNNIDINFAEYSADEMICDCAFDIYK